MLRALHGLYHRWLGIPDEPARPFEAEFAALTASLENRVPQSLLDKLAAIHGLLIEITQRIDQADDLAYVSHIVRQTVSSYLPGMVAAYLNVPAETAWTLKHPHTQLTALQSLERQLDILLGALQASLDKIKANQRSDLFVHQVFLSDKFNR